jgi:cytochrome c-type biogenesis protein CcsB
MFIIILENNLINFNFIILFLAMFLYWIESSFFFKSIINIPNILIIISNILQFLFLSLRWFTSSHFPLSNLYESLLFLSYSLTTILIILNFKNIKLNNENKIFLKSIFGSILTPLILLLNTFANFSLPEELKLVNSLVPALQSNWLLMHVTVMILSYAALLCGCLFSIAYLILTFFINFNLNNNLYRFKNLINKINFSFNNKLAFELGIYNKKSIYILDQQKQINNINANKNKSLSKNLLYVMLTLDNLSYRILGFGFPLLTMGLLSGAIWANQTWGSYWSWDPKETWALITWFIFAIYFHTRLSKGWNGFKSALLATFGFIIIWICYLGVNLMGKGLHSYGFL